MLNFAAKGKGVKTDSILTIETVLNLAATILVVAVLLKAVIDIDNSYDPGWYHLPFAGRIWGILPKETFIGDEEWFEPRFEGFPLSVEKHLRIRGASRDRSFVENKAVGSLQLHTHK